MKYNPSSNVLSKEKVRLFCLSCILILWEN